MFKYRFRFIFADMLKKIPPYLKNKFVIALLAFFIWVMFFDRNSMIIQYRLSSTLNDLESEKTYYKEAILTDSAALHELAADKNKLEKYAREKYLMKRDNEDIYLIINEDD